MTTELRVRRAEENDLDAWAQLFADVGGEAMWIGSEQSVRGRWMDERFHDVLGRDDAVTFVAMEGDELVGTITVEDTRGCAELGMMVRDGDRGRGVGSALMEACLAWCFERRAHRLELTVWPHNGAAIALYRKFGLEVEGRQPRRYRRATGELWDAVLMGRVLDTTSPGSRHPDAAGLAQPDASRR